jgi:hypothetical protein
MDGSMTGSVRGLFRPAQRRQFHAGADGAEDGTSGGWGGFPGHNGGWGLARGWLLAAGLAACATVVNALTVQADAPGLAYWQPWALEGSSTMMLILLAWLPGLAVLSVRRGRLHWSSLLVVHLGAVLLFSLLHVLGMVLLRQGFYAMAGAAYHFGSIRDHYPYEARKDLLTYAIFVAVFWAAAGRREIAKTSPLPRDFDIADGRDIIRTPLSHILAVASAGNYVEFVLADGRRPLMRTTLASVQAKLASSGFVRTHRGWLVNAARLTALRPQGSGDWIVDLGEVSAPLSRRYPQALAWLKASYGAAGEGA